MSMLKEIAEEEYKMEMTPMIDVTFLLLIFFLCTIKFKTLEGKLSAYLPKDVGVNTSQAEPIEKVEILLKVQQPGKKMDPFNANKPWKGDGRFQFVGREVLYAIGPRKEMGMRTIFNILGPMTNPAGVKRLLVGVYDAKLCRPVAEVLNRLGAEHVMVVHSEDGLDEISAAAPTHIAEARDGEIREYDVAPADLGLTPCSLDGLEVQDAGESLELIREALSGAPSDRARRARTVVALNAGAALYVAGLSADFRAGVTAAAKLLESGKPWARIEALADFTATL